MKKRGITTVYEGRVPFHDCDPLGICWHGHYYKYLELARTEHLRRFRLDVPDFVELGHRLLVIESRCRYAFPLRYDEAYAVSAWFIDTEQRLHIGYEVRNLAHGRRAAKAWTTLVCTDRRGEMLFQTPLEVQRRIAAGPVEAESPHRTIDWEAVHSAERSEGDR